MPSLILPSWLHPRFLALYFHIPIFLIAYFTPKDSYEIIYKTEKYIDLKFILIGLLLYVAFAAGSSFIIGKPAGSFLQRINNGRGTGFQGKQLFSYCRVMVWPLFFLTLLGYFVWVASAIQLSGGVNQLLKYLLLMVLADDDTSFYLKSEVFKTIPGITTLVNLGGLYATIEAWLRVHRKAWNSSSIIRLTIIALLTFLRSVLYSERLAIIEFIVPITVIFLSYSKQNLSNRFVKRFIPIFAIFFLFFIFAFGEYFRSWSYYQYTYQGTYLQFAFERLLGYYATAINNASIYYYFQDIQFMKATLGSLFAFPGFGEVITEIHSNIFSFHGLDPETLLKTYGNVELNNVATIGLLLNDCTIFLAPIVSFLIGALSFRLYQSFAQGCFMGLVLYPTWYIGLLELSRLYYWPNQRYFPTLLFLAISVLLLKNRKPLEINKSLPSFPK